jgi:hypothetical protein
VRTVDAEIAKLEKDLAAGAPWTLIAEPMEARRRRRTELQNQIVQCTDVVQLATLRETRALRVELATRLTDWQGLLGRQPVHARQILKKLLEGRLAFPPFDDARGRGHEIRGKASYGRLLHGIVPVEGGGSSLVPPG